jgi:hypothetical protein
LCRFCSRSRGRLRDGWSSARVQWLLALATIMLGAFLYVESKSAEPMIPLALFRHPVIRICSVCVFALGMGMFGVIIYLPLFMQGVLGVSATQSGNLLTPLMTGAATSSTIFFRSIAVLFLEPVAARTDAAADRSELRADPGRAHRAAGAVRRRTDVAITRARADFLWSAVTMTAAALVHLALRSEPLRTEMAEPDALH